MTNGLCRRKIFGIDPDGILGERIALLAVPIGFQRAVDRKRVAAGAFKASAMFAQEIVQSTGGPV